MEEESNDPETDLLALDCCGTSIHVRRQVLTQVEGSLLAAKFSGRWETKVRKDGLIEMDIPVEMFRPLVDSLRLRWNLPNYDTSSSVSIDDFGGNASMFCRYLNVVDHFGLLSTFYPVRLCPEADHQRDYAMASYISDEIKFYAEERATFQLLPDDPRLVVSAVEIDLDEPTLHEDVQPLFRLGWLTCVEGRGEHMAGFEHGLYFNKYDLRGKRWHLECRNRGTLRITITAHDDTERVIETTAPPPGISLRVAQFEAVGTFRLSNLKVAPTNEGWTTL